MDFNIDIAGGTVDRDEGIAFAPLQGRQMLQVEVNEADAACSKTPTLGLSGFLRWLISWR
jgi:hypothetical protein